ncbi:unnamed protein product [Caenorhabditis bovis]|uniref:Serpentine receptor class gamma n=1 Tax=Caenorhabditis bovis TaxID=2654633 RepID=A0A8S1FER4_9PELO|nr:unnamed protein product [Caenorhabditis bovis]
MTDSLTAVPQTTLEIYCMILYLAVLIGLVTTSRPNLRKPFFHIFISTGFMDVLSIVSNMYLRLSIQYHLGPEQADAFMWANYLSDVAILGHLIGNILLQFNRFTSVVTPEFHLKV